ncbi:hypothetical protein [Deinococcus aquaedulcis]|uniref:hypothetical protein n=1 Tax=Deinococcus aquaedulcis TaxID=2840455 RepID=UPI001C8377D6|nr:hypothetical protein [Deinococcus aquaedulcis]
MTAAPRPPHVVLSLSQEMPLLAAPPAARPVYVLEVLAPDDAVPTVPGWTLRAWPVARLGDLTLQAVPQGHEDRPADLRRVLQGAGLTPLGPVRCHAG